MSVPPAWSTPAQIRSQVQRLWDDGRLLAARVQAQPLFPLELRLRQPTVAELGEQFDAVRNWIRALEAGAKPVLGHGYDIAWREINHRQLGRNHIPDKAVLETEADALRLIGRATDAKRFDQLAAATLHAFPQLRDWLARRALVLVEQAAAWERILAILSWFVRNPRPGQYLRQLDIAGVDTKFIETRKGLLSELLDQLMPAHAIDHAMTGARQFEARYGLLGKPALLRFRMLDAAHAIGGLSDLTVPVAQFASLKTDLNRIFITENEINFLAFPPMASGMVIFGGGYGIDRLADVGWLREREVMYWGDIDTHGFRILDCLRASLPQARSMLMDEATLLAHRAMWGTEEKDKRYTGQLSRLDAAEQRVFEALRDDLHGERIRMEQERIAFSCVTAALG